MKWMIVDDVPSAEIGYRAIVDAAGFTICNPSPMGDANARLIAAAPDLLKALKHLVRWHDQLSRTDIAMAESVIAKVERLEA